MPTWTFKIYPSIGIARLGNCPGDSAANGDFYVGPEIPGSVVVPANGYKDAAGRVRRQAARFRVYGWEDGVFMGELTSPTVNIAWQVELANTKAAFNQFQGIGHTNGPLRNASVADRSSLKITPGPRMLNGPNGQAKFDTGTFQGTNVPLGEIQTDGAGRLLVLGGFGNSNSPSGAHLTTFANNDGWHDDVSDGPVNAWVSIPGVTNKSGPIQAAGAWVICPPPRFAPPVTHSISLYDALLQAAVDRYGYPGPSFPVSFTNDVYPILRTQLLMQFVNSHLPSSYYTQIQTAMSPTATYAQRDAVFQQFRNPATSSTAATPNQMPAIWTDYFADLAHTNWVNHPFTPSQYAIMQAWRDGNFKNDWVGPPAPGAVVTPDGLTRAALENCSGGPFFPGIDTSFLTRDLYPFVEPFRLDQTAILPAPYGTSLQPGDLTRQNAVPWQTDFYDCDYQAPLSWWPSARPQNVFTAGSNKYVEWDHGVNSPAAMVTGWSSLGFLVQSGNAIIST